MNQANDNDRAAAVLATTFGVSAGLFGVVWVFSGTLSLDMDCGPTVMGSLFAYAIGVFAILKLELFDPADILPAALAGLWACFWPALSSWSETLPEQIDWTPDDIAWWGTWYAKLGVLLVILLIGHGARWWHRR
jgi:hypothetical protein